MAQVSASLAGAGLTILDLNSDVGGSDAKPIYIMMIEGYAPGGVNAVASVLEPVRLSGIEVTLSPIDTLVG